MDKKEVKPMGVYRMKYTILTLQKGVPSAVGFPHCAGSGEGYYINTTQQQQQQQQQQQHSLFSQASWGRLEMKPERNKFKVQAH